MTTLEEHLSLKRLCLRHFSELCKSIKQELDVSRFTEIKLDRIDTKITKLTLAEKMAILCNRTSFDGYWVDRVIDQGTARLTQFLS
jgi:hypothetical protein